MPGDVVADGRVDQEKLQELLSLGAEQEALDFKSTLDLSETKANLDFIKDMLAMMSLPEGGFLIVGVANDGSLAHDQEPIEPRAFDSASLLSKVRAYTDAPIDIRSAVWDQTDENGTRQVALVYAGPPPELVPIVVSRLGEIQLPNNRKKAILTPGQVVVREGTTITTLASRHWPRLLERYRRHVHEDARSDVDSLIRRVVESLGVSGSPAPVPPDFAMDLATFAEAADLVTRSGESGLIRRLLTPVPEEIRLAAASADDAQVADFLDRLTALSLSAIINDNADAFEQVVGAFGRYYDSVAAVSDAVSLTDTGSRRSATAWRDVVVRLYTIGSFAVRAGKLAFLRDLTLRPYRTAPHYAYVSWIRHGLVSAARANVLDSDPDPSGAAGSKTLISRALKLAADTPELRPDLPSLEDASAEERLLNSLCQFDIAACLIIQSAADTGHGGFYPSSAAFNQWRADPMFELAIGDGREALLPNRSDQQIADGIEAVFTLAESQSWNFGGTWTSLPGSVQLFIARARGLA